MKGVIGEFNVGNSTTHVASVIISSRRYVKKMFSLDSYYDKASIDKAIDAQIYPNGATYTGLAIDMVRTEVYTPTQDRPDVPNVCIIITDGKSSDGIEGPSDRLRSTGTTIFSVGVGKEFNKEELIKMAGDQRRVYTANFNHLQSVITEIKESACRGTHRTTFSYILAF